MSLHDYGYNKNVEKARVEGGYALAQVGRVIAEHRKRYAVMTSAGEVDAKITGGMRYAAKSRKDYPAVGD